MVFPLWTLPKEMDLSLVSTQCPPCVWCFLPDLIGFQGTGATQAWDSGGLALIGSQDLTLRSVIPQTRTFYPESLF